MSLSRAIIVRFVQLPGLDKDQNNKKSFLRRLPVWLIFRKWLEGRFYFLLSKYPTLFCLSYRVCTLRTFQLTLANPVALYAIMARPYITQNATVIVMCKWARTYYTRTCVPTT